MDNATRKGSKTMKKINAKKEAFQAARKKAEAAREEWANIKWGEEGITWAGVEAAWRESNRLEEELMG